YPPPTDGSTPKSWKDLRIETDVVNTRHSAYFAKWFFDQADGKVRMVEVRLAENGDPCEMYFSDWRQVNGKLLPHPFQVYHGDRPCCTMTISSYNMAAAK